VLQCLDDGRSAVLIHERFGCLLICTEHRCICACA
jgi:hypothetical protein